MRARVYVCVFVRYKRYIQEILILVDVSEERKGYLQDRVGNLGNLETMDNAKAERRAT